VTRGRGEGLSGPTYVKVGRKELLKGGKSLSVSKNENVCIKKKRKAAGGRKKLRIFFQGRGRDRAGKCLTGVCQLV